MPLISPFERPEDEDDEDSTEDCDDVGVEVEPVVRIVCIKKGDRFGSEVWNVSNVVVDEEEVCKVVSKVVVVELVFESERIMTRR